MTPNDRIIEDPAICAGQPVIRGTRVLARVIWGHLANGQSIDTILREFPSLTEEDVRAVLDSMASGTSVPLVQRESVVREHVAAAHSNEPAHESSASAERTSEMGAPNAALSYDADGVDRSLIRWMLRLTPRQRLDHVQGMIDLSRSVRRIPNGDR